MRTNAIKLPKFSTNQMVRFSGGIGKIIGYKSESGTWTYVVEMEMEPKPPIGRLGAETMLLLQELELQKMKN